MRRLARQAGRRAGDGPAGLATGLGGGGNGLARRRPAAVQLGQLPVDDGGGPDDYEKPGYGEARLVDVEVGNEVPEAAVDAQLASEQADDLDGPDQERDRDGQAGDDQVVVDLAHRLGERPAIGEVHEAPVQRVEQG